MSHDVIIMVRYRPGDDENGNGPPDVRNGHDTGIARLETPDWNQSRPQSPTYHRNLAVRHFLHRLE